MKFFASLLALASAVYAQNIVVSLPAAQASHPYGPVTLTAGQHTVVQIETPDFLSSSKEVAVAIGIVSCANSNGYCPPPSDTLGNLLYSGSYHPQRDQSNPTQQPFQNFAVTIPSHLQKGPAQIGVAHFALIGASLGPWLETKNISVVIQ